MKCLFEGDLKVHYGQAYVESGGESFNGDMDTTFRGQRNGLCGAAVGGTLFLITGLHTGRVKFRAELLDSPPTLDHTYEEIVEVSFRPSTDRVELVEWSGQVTHPLALEATDYRVRYSARGMDEGDSADTIVDDEPTVDSYLLQFWSAPPASDCIVKQTSQMAAYWHRYAGELKHEPALGHMLRQYGS